MTKRCLSQRALECTWGKDESAERQCAKQRRRELQETEMEKKTNKMRAGGDVERREEREKKESGEI